MSHGECDDYWDLGVPHWFMHYLDDGEQLKGLTQKQKIDLAKTKYDEFNKMTAYLKKWNVMGGKNG